jgi:hypothetical protein
MKESTLKQIVKSVTLELRHLLEGWYGSDGKWKPGVMELRSGTMHEGLPKH